jgi:hypothetical protein
MTQTASSKSCGSEKPRHDHNHLKLLRNSSSRRSVTGRTAQNADPLGEGGKFGQGLNLHFLDHPLAVGFDCAFGRAQRARDLFVGLAANDKLEDLPLARRVSRY